jgi:hypothetical protein
MTSWSLVAMLVAAGFAAACGEPTAAITDASGDGVTTDGTATDDARIVDASLVDGNPGDAAVVCAGRDSLSCRATAGCVAAYCPGCNCDPGYAGCIAASDPPPLCPIIECPFVATCCEANGDCTAVGGTCQSPGEPGGCGICNPTPSQCTTDSDCQGTAQVVGVGVLICQPVACACTAASSCVPGCTGDPDCGLGETCDLIGGRCHPRACSGTAPCPPDFDCGVNGCVRRTCTSDATCDGFCVEGVCRDQLGQCVGVPA